MENKIQTTNKPVRSSETGTLPVRYIRQPYPISAMQANLSKQQIRLLIGMMQSIQDGVQKMFERGANEKGQLLLFPDTKEDTVSVEFKFSDVAVRTDAYSDIEAIADNFMQMVFRYEDKENGEVILSHFVHNVVYPGRESFFDGKKRKRDKIRFIFTKEQAEVAFNFARYSRYMLSVASEAESKHTARIYMLITSASGFGHEGNGIYHWYVRYEELRRILGCDEKEGNKWVRRRQKQYKHFKADVLRVAERELRQLADDGKADCWFEFVELPENFIGEPQRFDFVVHTVQTVKAITAEDAPTVGEGTPNQPTAKKRGRPRKNTASVTDPLRQKILSLGVDVPTAETLIEQMSGHLDALAAKAQELQQDFADRKEGLAPGKPAVKNCGPWAKKSLLDFVTIYKAQHTHSQTVIDFSDAPEQGETAARHDTPTGEDYATSVWEQTDATGRLPHVSMQHDARALLWRGLRHYIGEQAKWIAPYEEVAKWCADNRGRGLLCVGSCGLGKTRICKDIIPALFRHEHGTRFQMLAVNATEMNPRIDELLKFCKPNRMIIVDDLGTEATEAWVGYRKRNPFCELVNAAEQNGTLLIITTNLTVLTMRQQDGTPDPLRSFPSIEQRYGIPTIDRLRATTKVVVFSGESMRK